MTNENKLCKDCKWMSKGWLASYEFAKCNSPKNVTFDKVSGKMERQYIYCSTHRKSDTGAEYDCGSEGRYWEPK